MKLVTKATCLLAIVALEVLCEPAPTVEIKQGKLVGKHFKSGLTRRKYNSFKGIPYARPPVDNLRFLPPRPHKGWEGERDAASHGFECVQIDINFEEEAHGSEDCLFVNVYTPYMKSELPDSVGPMPVMFYVHGGHFHSGSGDASFHGPGFLMEEDVVLVTVNYRLGALGFLDLEDDVIAGNMGLKDIVLALRWVKDNVAEFCGDPDLVTVFGHSSGAVAIDLINLSPHASGLYKRAILQSGSSLMSSYLDWGRLGRAIQLAKEVGQDSERGRDLEKTFREMPALAFPLNQTRCIGVDETKEKQIGFIPFSASISLNGDHSFITEYPEDIFKSGVLTKPEVSIMIGYNSQESIFSHRYYVMRPPFLHQFNKRFEYLFPLRGLWAKFRGYYYHEVAYRLKHFYFPPNGTLDGNDPNEMNRFLDWQSDHTVYPVDRSAKLYANASSAPVYYYEFSYEGGYNHFKSLSTTTILGEERGETSKVRGAAERDDLCYMFRCGKIGAQYKGLKQDSDDAKTIRRLVRLWTNFARTGNPTPKDDNILEGLQWDPIDKDNVNYLDIGYELKMGKDPHKERIEFWDAMYEHYKPLAKGNILYGEFPKDEL